MPKYPASKAARNQWILEQRHNVPRADLNPFEPHAFWCEDERSASGETVSVATLLLTNRECPWKCLMCDLWRHTLTTTAPLGAIPAQIHVALDQLRAARQIKLYNSGSFFDKKAIPPDDYAQIAERARHFERVIVECHPKLINESCLRFRDLLGEAKLEIAMGLETVHPEVGPLLNKGATLQDFQNAADFLAKNDIALRVFILVKPPFLNEDEALLWANRSTDFAFGCGADVVVLIPTRRGNGAMEALEKSGDWSPPRLKTLENSANYGLALQKGRVFADLWDLQQFSTCEMCFAARRERLETMNFTQQILPPIECVFCHD